MSGFVNGVEFHKICNEKADRAPEFKGFALLFEIVIQLYNFSFPFFPPNSPIYLSLVSLKVITISPLCLYAYMYTCLHYVPKQNMYYKYVASMCAFRADHLMLEHQLGCSSSLGRLSPAVSILQLPVVLCLELRSHPLPSSMLACTWASSLFKSYLDSHAGEASWMQLP